MWSRTNAMRIICCSVAVMIFAGASYSEDAPLKLKFTEGTKTRHEQELKQHQNLKVAGQELEIDLTLNNDYTMTVKKVNPSDGSAELAVKYHRVQMKMDSPMNPVDIDTDKKDGEDNEMRKVFTAMVENEFIITMSPNGEVTKAQLPKEFSKAVENAGPAAQQMSFLSEDSIRQSFGAMLALPDTAMTNGKTWSHEFKSENPMMTVKSKVNYTDKGTTSEGGKEFRKIAFKPSVEMEGKAGAIQVKIKEQNIEGTILFDAEAGRIHQVNSEQKLTLEINANGQEIESKIDQKTSMKIKLDK